MYKVAILVEKELAYSIFREKDLAFLSTFATFNPIDELPEKITPEFMETQLTDADACITCWRTPTFSKELLDKHPKLRFIMHGAGAVRNLVCPEFWTMQGRHISSNAPVIAEDVAQTTLALILASLKQMWAFNAMTHAGGNDILDTAPTFKTVEDDGAFQLSKEEAGALAQRQYKFIQNLEVALVRIENKSYGICRVTGKLIPKERLRLVPHATLTVEAKEMLARQGKN